MRILTEPTRVCALCIALLAAIILAFGCGHADGQPYPAGTDSIDIPEEGYAPYSLSATLAATSLHTMDLDFSDPMTDSTVEVRVIDEQGIEMSDATTFWSDDRQTLSIKGPFAYCRTYVVTLLAGAQNAYGHEWKDDVEMSTTVGANPFDIDGSADCTADVVVSPLLTDSVDGAIFLGETIAPEANVRTITRTELSADDVWYVDGTTAYTSANGMARIPSFAGDGTAGAAKLFWREYRNAPSGALLSTKFTLDFWDAYNPANQVQSTKLISEASGSPAEIWQGPIDAGDIDGDGHHEVIVSEQISNNMNDLRQGVVILPGALDHGYNETIAGAAMLSADVGFSAEILEPFTSVGDIDGDGKDDLASIRHKRASNGSTSDWQLWIAYGSRDPEMLFYGAGLEKMKGLSKNVIVDVDGGDLDGDGINDLIVADMEKKTSGSTTKFVNPHVNIFFGGARQLGEGNIYAFNSQIKWINSYMSDVKARVLGDINGDGFDDLAILIEEEDNYGRLKSLNLYVMYGHQDWIKGYTLNSKITPAWGIKIPLENAPGTILKDDVWDPALGDIDNDGYDDFALKAYDDGGYSIFWFFGGSSFNGAGRVVELGDAAAIWAVETEN
jgi:hypothetical protein